MLLSLIIPTCNRNELLGKCLDRLMPGTQTLAADAYEVIVSDDGAGKKSIRHKHLPNLGSKIQWE